MAAASTEEKKENPLKFEDANLDPSKYTENRKNWLQAERDAGRNPYPHKFNRTHTIGKFAEEFESKCEEKGAFLEDTEVAITGRVNLIRAQGKKLIFIDIQQDGLKVQVMAQFNSWQGGDFIDAHKNIRRGDLIGVKGNPGRTKRGELSIRAYSNEILSYCLHQLPMPPTTLQSLNKDTRYR